MGRYVVDGKSGVTAATIDHVVAELWNPSTSKRIKLLELWVPRSGSGDVEPCLRRTTAKGTSGSTVTPTAVNEHEQIAAPPSAFTLELATFSVQPTLATGDLTGWCFGTPTGSGVLWLFDNNGLEIPAAAGLALTTGVAVAWPATRVTAVVED